MIRLCDDCEFGADGVEAGVCRKAFALYVSEQTIRDPEVRLRCQNYMVDLAMPYRKLVDWIIHALRDFNGRYRDEQGNVVPVPGIASILTPASEFWFRDMIENGKWQTVDDVPRLRRETVARWRLIATVVGILETVQPICRR